jgi:hypothetical protein
MLKSRSSFPCFSSAQSAAAAIGCLGLALALGACSPADEAQQPATPQPSAEPPGAEPPGAEQPDAGDAGPFIPEATVEEVMEYVVMPNAQILWDAVAITVSLEGTIESKPETDEDWDRVRAAAITLAEACNAIMIRGRAVAAPGAVSEYPEEELDPADIQELRQQNWGAWVAHAQVLHATVDEALDAIDNRDSDSLMEAGGALDEACESCHLQFWYPPKEGDAD